jgi:hypothetical protein
MLSAIMTLSYISMRIKIMMLFLEVLELPCGKKYHPNSNPYGNLQLMVIITP